MHPSNPDPMQLHSPPPSMSNPEVTYLLQDSISFTAQIRKLKSGKATGPDGLANEAIKWAPSHLHELTFQLFQLLWKMKYTPPHWMQSITTLLWKKGDITELNNYRPIAMANTIGKLWTGYLCRGVNLFVERHNILSTTQEGFRTDKNCHRQLRTIINAIEDAQFHHKDMYLLYIDLSAAFNTIQFNSIQYGYMNQQTSLARVTGR
jgi:hypothetical protein